MAQRKSFRNLIREDQQKAVEASIWNQIESGSKNDYIHYQLRRQDGTYIPVLDQGRIVETNVLVEFSMFYLWIGRQCSRIIVKSLTQKMCDNFCHTSFFVL